MTMKWKCILAAALVVLAATYVPPRAVAEAAEETTIEEFDSGKFWAYAGCAASIALGVGTGAWLLAAIACGKAATAYWTK
jgi:hypothetical protein